MLQTILRGPEFVQQIADQVGDDLGGTVYTGYGDPLTNALLKKFNTGATSTQYSIVPKSFGTADPNSEHGLGVAGTKTLETVPVATKKKGILDTLMGILPTVAQSLGTYVGTKKAAQNGVATGTYVAGAQPIVYSTTEGGFVPAPIPDTDKKKKTTNLILIVAAVVLVGLLVAVIAKKK